MNDAFLDGAGRRSYHFYVAAILVLALAGCGPSEHQKAKRAEEKRIDCLDKVCEGDTPPRPNTWNESVLKLNGQWYAGPAEYFGTFGRAEFEWWDHKPLSSRMRRPPELQKAAIEGKGYDFSIEIFLRSTNLPESPHGYALIALAEKNDWVASRRTLRPGLDAVTMKNVIGPRDQRIDHVTYYVATQLTGVDGLPPVATCNHDHPSNGGGSGFLWRSDIWVGIRMNQQHCADWPEIHTEVARVLQLLKKI